MRQCIGCASGAGIFLVVININELKTYFQLHCRHCKYNPYSHDVQTNIALKQLANNNPHHHNQEPYYLQIRHKFHLPIFEKLWNGWYILDILWGQLIKLVQVASTSELRENQRNDLLFFEIVPCSKNIKKRGSPPYVDFGTWKKPHYSKIALVGL